MDIVQILVNANWHVKKDTLVSIKVDASKIKRNVVRLRFDNGDYCDFNTTSFHDTTRYISTYENVYAKDAFVEQLKEGKITIKDENGCIIDLSDTQKKGI